VRRIEVRAAASACDIGVSDISSFEVELHACVAAFALTGGGRPLIVRFIFEDDDELTLPLP
jgi:hypothetical protein